MATVSLDVIDPAHFRRVLGHHGTGIAVVTAAAADLTPVGMAVTSFTSISLDPPLVAFCPDKGSRTWPLIEQVGRFCVNLLSHDQEAMCRAFATRGADKFAGVDFALSERGMPVLSGTLATIECDVHAVVDAGDHFVVLGRVLALEADSARKPLLFFQGGYGTFTP